MFACHFVYMVSKWANVTIANVENIVMKHKNVNNDDELRVIYQPLALQRDHPYSFVAHNCM